MAQPALAPDHAGAPLGLLSLVLFVDSFGYAVVVPLLPLAALSLGTSERLIGIIFASYSLGQLLAAPVLGALSDRHGRRPLLLTSLAGSAVGFALMIGAGSPWPLLLSRLLDGLTAGNVSIVYAAVLDRESPDRWTLAFARLAAATGLGLLFGLLLSALLAGAGLNVAAAVALGLTLVSLILIAVWFGETAQRRPVAPLLGAWQALGSATGGTTRRALLVSLLAAAAQTAFLLTLPLFLLRRLGYHEQESGRLILVLFTLAAAFQVLALGPLVSRLDARRMALLAFGLVAIGNLGLTVALDLIAVLTSAVPLMFGLVSLAPATTALVAASNRALDEGAIMGLNQSALSTGQLLGPLLGYTAVAWLSSSSASFGALGLVLAGFGLLSTVLLRASDESN